jgi:hypothetical protein
MTFQAQCALVALPACSGHPGFYIGSEDLLVGCVSIVPAKYLRMLGRFCFETFLRSACLEWLYQTLAAMQDIWMSLHSICSRSMDFLASSSTDPSHRNYSYDIIGDFFIRRNFQDLAGYPQILGIVYLRPLRGRHAYKGLPKVAPARLLVAMT